MTLNEYIRILRRRGWIIVAAALLAAVAAFGVSYVQEDIYRATVQVSTVPARADFGLAGTAKDLMRNFVTRAHTHEVAQEVISAAQLDMQPNDFLGNATASEDASTFIIDFEFRARDPSVAATAAVAWAQNFVDDRQQYYAQQDKRDRIEVLFVSREPQYAQIQPNPEINAIAGGVLGTMLGIAVVLLLTWMEADRLRTVQAVERALGVPVLGAIPVVDSPRAAPQRTARRGRVGAPEAA